MRRRPTQLTRLGRKRATLVLTTAVMLALLSFGLAGASADPLPITYTIDGIAGSNGWYRGSSFGNLVVVRWTINVPVLQDCPHAMQVNGPTTGATRSCTITLTDGSQLTRTTSAIKIDATPPTAIMASLSRAPDFNGWYNHRLGITWHGSDATSGIASCTSLAYGGPDRAAATVAGGCTDIAGNSASAPVSINYDATAPVLSKVWVTSRAGSDLVHWRSTSAGDTAVVQRRARGAKRWAAVFRGAGAEFVDKTIRNDLEYTYSVQTVDQAGNASRSVAAAGLPKVLTLRKLPYVPRAAARPILRWNAKRGATYYHVQLFRGSKRVLAAWPGTHQLGLPVTWRWSGHRYRLTPGKYRWYVWEGVGQRSFARYRTIGSAKFIVPKR